MIIQLKGHLDTAKVAEVQKEIYTRLVDADANENVVVDCSELDFISSSELRNILGIRKKFPSVVIQDVSPSVYNVFEMTGFTRMLDIRKALRKVNLDDCEIIGEGGNGAVYRINDEEIVKISKHPQGDKNLVNENIKQKEAFLLGMPTVISFDTVDCGNERRGIVMEALNSQSFGAYISEDPARMEEIIPKYVELFR